MTADQMKRHMRHIGRAALGATIAAMVVGPAAASAQVIRGLLIDDGTNRGIEGGRMSLMLGERVVDRMLSDSTGAFLLTAPEDGMYGVAVERIGYRATRSTLLNLEVGDTLTVEYRILPEAMLLEPMLVTATSRAGKSQFLRRMEAGAGQFLTRPTLDSLDLWHPGQVFRHVEGFYLFWRWGTFESGSQGMIPGIRSSRGQGCVGYLLDGMAAGPRFIADRGKNPWSLYPLDTLTPEEIMGMEFYRYVGEVPEELRNAAEQAQRGMGTGGMCGLVVIWTRARW
jgi:hypothetical protein